MANLNRLKVVLAEQQKTGKWLAVNGVVILFNQTSKPLMI